MFRFVLCCFYYVQSIRRYMLLLALFFFSLSKFMLPTWLLLELVLFDVSSDESHAAVLSFVSSLCCTTVEGISADI